MREKGFYLKIRIAALFLLIITFCILTALIPSDNMAAFESSVYTGIAQFMNPTLTNIMITVTNMGSTTAVIVIVVVFLAMPFTRMKFGFPIAINAAVTAALNSVLKHIAARPRPDIL